MTDNDVRRFIRQLNNISTTPAMLGRILSTAGDDTKSILDLCDLISHDQALAQRVLRLANSAFFAHAGQITDIQQAILFLGLDRVKSIVTGMTVMNVFPQQGSFRVENLWVHSYEVAFLSSLLTERVAIAQPQESFLAGLLHDIGRVVLYSMDHISFERIETTDTMLDQETGLFGCTHAVAGAMLAEEAGLPNCIYNAIRYHHKPSAAPDDMNLVSLVALAEALVRTLRPRVEDDGIWTTEHAAILLEFSLSNDNLHEIRGRFMEAQPDIERFFTPDQKAGESDKGEPPAA